MHLEKVELNIVTSNYHRNYYQFSELLGLTCDYIVLQVFLFRKSWGVPETAVCHIITGGDSKRSKIIF